MLSDSEDYGDSDAEEDLSVRSLSVSKSPLRDELVPLLECPVCLDLPLPPIRTCCQGHIICASCCPKLRLCPLCQQHIGTGRNFFAEDFLNKSLFRCKYYEDGCLEELVGSRILKHVQECFYRPLKCRQCNKKVAFTDIDQHLQKEHKISRWDLTEEGERIVTCQKLRTRNPHGIIIENEERSFGYLKALMLSATVSLILCVDLYLLDVSSLEQEESMFTLFLYQIGLV